MLIKGRAIYKAEKLAVIPGSGVTSSGSGGGGIIGPVIPASSGSTSGASILPSSEAQGSSKTGTPPSSGGIEKEAPGAPGAFKVAPGGKSMVVIPGGGLAGSISEVGSAEEVPTYQREFERNKLYGDSWKGISAYWLPGHRRVVQYFEPTGVKMSSVGTPMNTGSGVGLNHLEAAKSLESQGLMPKIAGHRYHDDGQQIHSVSMSGVDKSHFWNDFIKQHDEDRMNVPYDERKDADKVRLDLARNLISNYRKLHQQGMSYAFGRDLDDYGLAVTPENKVLLTDIASIKPEADINQRLGDLSKRILARNGYLEKLLKPYPKLQKKMDDLSFNIYSRGPTLSGRGGRDEANKGLTELLEGTYDDADRAFDDPELLTHTTELGRDIQKRFDDQGIFPDSKEVSLVDGSNLIGGGSFGTVYYVPGKTNMAIKYVKSKPALHNRVQGIPPEQEFEFGKRAAEIGLGPRYYGIQKDNNREEHKIGIEFLKDHKEVGQYFLDLTRALKTVTGDERQKLLKNGYDTSLDVLAKIKKLHLAGISHGDLNKRNVLISPDNKSSLIDWGASSNGFKAVKDDVKNNIDTTEIHEPIVDFLNVFNPVMASKITNKNKDFLAEHEQRRTMPELNTEEANKELVQKYYDDLDNIIQSHQENRDDEVIKGLLGIILDIKGLISKSLINQIGQETRMDREESRKESPAMKLMIKRKGIVRKMRGLDQDIDREQYLLLKQEAADLLNQVDALGGLTGEEAQVLAMVH